MSLLDCHPTAAMCQRCATEHLPQPRLPPGDIPWQLLSHRVGRMPIMSDSRVAAGVLRSQVILQSYLASDCGLRAPRSLLDLPGGARR